MRRVVGLLRDPAEGEELHPQPGLDDIPALVARARAAGTAVELVLRPPSHPPASSVQLAVYRLVQEGLTNAARHAPGAGVGVRVEGDAATLSVEVVSRGGGPARAPAPATARA